MKITNLLKNYQNFSLNVEALEIKTGKTYGLIGANGCGKTTLLKMIGGITKADSGTIDYEGLTPREITMVSRKPYLLHTSVYNNLVYPLKLRKIKLEKALIEHYLELVGLEDRQEQYARSLSTGQQQKLSLIRALIFEPKLILIDEAFSNLDIESVYMFEKLIIENQKENPTTWIVVSHQLSHINRLCEEAIFMNQGKTEDWGKTEEMLINPQNQNLKHYLQYEVIRES